MSEELEWTYKEDTCIGSHYYIRLKNDHYEVYLSVSIHKERWHFYSSIDHEYIQSTWSKPGHKGYNTHEEAQQAAIQHGKNAIDLEHIDWFTAYDQGFEYLAAWYKPLNGRLSVFQMCDEAMEPIDNTWLFQVWAPPDYDIFSIADDDEEFTSAAEAQKACIEAATILRKHLEKKNARDKAEHDRKAKALQSREAANVDVKYVEGKPTLFD